MNKEGIKETMSVDKLLEISQKVLFSVGPVIDEQIKQDASIAEITLGIADGIKKLLCLYAATRVPQLNADPIIETAALWMKSDIESEIDDIENALKLFHEREAN